MPKETVFLKVRELEFRMTTVSVVVVTVTLIALGVALMLLNQ